MVERAPWVWSSEALDPIDMYMTRPYVEGLIAGTMPDHVAVSHSGHGVNSYALSFGIAWGQLGLLAQVAWGGAYDDAAQAARRWDEALSRCQRIVAVIQPPFVVADRKRVVYVESDYRQIRNCLIANGDLGAIERILTDDVNPTAVEDAIAWLQARRTP